MLQRLNSSSLHFLSQQLEGSLYFEPPTQPLMIALIPLILSHLLPSGHILFASAATCTRHYDLVKRAQSLFYILTDDACVYLHLSFLAPQVIH